MPHHRSDQIVQKLATWCLPAAIVYDLWSLKCGTKVDLALHRF